MNLFPYPVCLLPRANLNSGRRSYPIKSLMAVIFLKYLPLIIIILVRELK